MDGITLAAYKLGALAAGAPLVLAEDGGEATSTVVDATKALATTVTQQGTDAIGGLLPIMAGLLAAGIVVTLGVKWVKRFGRG